MRIFTLLLFLAVSAGAHADRVQPAGEDDPLVRGTIYTDLARAGDRVVAVGDRGHIIYSDDEGLSWEQAETPSGVLLTAVCFANEQAGWAVGHDAVILATRDGGESWTKQYSDELVVDDDPHDAGSEESWDDEDYSDDDDFDMDEFYEDDFDDFGVDTSGAPLLDLWCRGEEEVIAVGGFGYVAITRDGGFSWEQDTALLDNPDGWHLYAISPLEGAAETVLVVGEQGTLFRSDDHGETYEVLDSPYHGSFFGVTSSDPETLLVHGLQGNIWLSRDRGEQWERIDAGLSTGVNAGVVLADGTIVLVGNAGAVLTSRDRGQNFEVRHVAGRQSISSVLSRQGDAGVIIAGAGGVRVLEEIR